jgi:sugar lactone lactonase YvrE
MNAIIAAPIGAVTGDYGSARSQSLLGHRPRAPGTARRATYAAASRRCFMNRRARLRLLTVSAAVATAVLSAPALAEPPVFPDVIALPNGWLPEGIAIGPGSTFYSGSRANGAIYRGDVRTGQGEVFIDGQDGRVAVGLEYDSQCGLLFVAGGPTGDGYVYDSETGAERALFQFTSDASFVNDVVMAAGAAYFTDSLQAVLYRVELTDCLPGPVEVIDLGGDWTQVPGFNANGIVADPSGRRLLVVNSATGGLFRVDPTTGAAELIDAPAVPLGDGLLLRDRTLFVVQNRFNQIAVIELDPDWASGQRVDVLTDPNFDTPTTIARFGNALYAINARFSVQPTPDTPYNVVRVGLH